MRQISVGSLCTEFTELLKKHSYSPDSLRRYNKVFDEFTEYAGERLYSQQLGAEFLAQKFVAVGGFVEEGLYAKDEMYFFRAMRSLAEYYNFGVMLRRKDIHGEIVWPEPFRECTETFLQSKVEYGVSYGYLKTSRMVLKDFLLMLDALDVHKPEDIEYTHVERYIDTLQGWSVSTVRSRISLVRCYLRFLYLNGYNSRPLSEKMPKGISPRGMLKVPSVWTEEEIERLVKSVDTGNPNGKRNYAILLIAARLGLRIGDIRDLELSSFNWEARTLTITQNKTKEPVTLPIPNDVGWAVIDYLKNGRPVTESSRVFVRHVPPYDRFSITNSLYGLLNKALKDAGIDTERGGHNGFHTLRHSLATHLLQNGVGAPTISDILGHTSPDTVKHYLRADIQNLRKCALEVEVMPYVSE